ncbi:hypothetical protein E2562_017347 [Oryza meyeriana var. granulata]|uniref:Uncharacterized protein n=1 Tax=Oryza meyeriana var. granulata TaxID=110450 RepID=A0A6G1BWW8_9ORYZ|nr:hypothetical protein E2562_017347 [Oryza meyeriana var. granulata]
MLVKGREDGGWGLAVGLTEWEGGGQAEECGLTVIESRKREKEGRLPQGLVAMATSFFTLVRLSKAASRAGSGGKWVARWSLAE